MTRLPTNSSCERIRPESAAAWPSPGVARSNGSATLPRVGKIRICQLIRFRAAQVLEPRPTKSGSRSRQPPSISFQPTGVIGQLRETSQRSNLVAIPTQEGKPQPFFGVRVSSLRTIDNCHRRSEPRRPGSLAAFNNEKPTYAPPGMFCGVAPAVGDRQRQ